VNENLSHDLDLFDQRLLLPISGYSVCGG